MNIPYLENTTLGIEISERTLRWVEASKIGSSIRVKSSGTIIHNNSDASLKSGFEEIKTHINADVFKVAVSNTDFLIAAITEEIPFFDEEDSRLHWVENRKKELLDEFGESVRIRTHISYIDEDYSRCLFVITDSEKIARFEGLLSQSELFINCVYIGCFEAAYTQINNSKFAEDLAFVLIPEDTQSYLSCFTNGLLSNFFVLDVGLNDGAIRLIKESQSIAQTEILNQNKEESKNKVSIPDYARQSFTEVSKDQNCIFFKAATSNKEEVGSEFITAYGSCVKSFFSGLDNLDFVSDAQLEISHNQFEKKAAVKASVLLVVPLVLIMLCTYLVSSYLNIQLSETNQIAEKVADKLELVSKKRETVVEKFKEFNQVKGLIEQRVNSAIIFQELNEAISSNVWLTSIGIKKIATGYELRLIGEANEANEVTEFMRKLERSAVISQVRLISSGNIENRSSSQTNRTKGVLTYELKATFKS